jgi:hypothetical protein
MRAIYKFPALAAPVVGQDEICPCLQIRNTYDGSARISVHLGAFRFVCTNLAIGGTAAFAGGFVSIHAGEIQIDKIADQLADYLTRFDRIVDLYRRWSDERPDKGQLETVLQQALDGRFAHLRKTVFEPQPQSVFEAYNRLTRVATHSLRSARRAFEMLERVNASFQRTFHAPGDRLPASAIEVSPLGLVGHP